MKRERNSIKKQMIDVSGNDITDISVLKNLSELETLYMYNCENVDITPLESTPIRIGYGKEEVPGRGELPVREAI